MFKIIPEFMIFKLTFHIKAIQICLIQYFEPQNRESQPQNTELCIFR